MQSYAYEKRMLVVGSVDRLEDLHKKHQMAAKDIESLLEGVEMYIKRTLYTDSKKKELEQSKDKVVQMAKHQEMIKVAHCLLGCTDVVPEDRRKLGSIAVPDCSADIQVSGRQEVDSKARHA